MSGISCRASIVMVLTLAPCLWAGPAEDYKLLFGEEETRVLAGRNSQAIAAFAAKLVAAAERLNDSPLMQVLLYEKAFELGSRHRLGNATAIKALDALAALQPDKKDQWDDKRLLLLEQRTREGDLAARKQAAGELLAVLVSQAEGRAAIGDLNKAIELYRRAQPAAALADPQRGREIMARQRELALEQAEAKRRELRVKLLTQRLEKDPKDKAARQELVLEYLVGAGDVKKARELLTNDVDAKLRTNLARLGTPPEDLPEQQVLELAEWLKGLAGQVKGHPARRLLGRAKPYYANYLDRHQTQDVTSLQAKLAMEAIGDIEAEEAEELAGSLIFPPCVVAAYTFDAPTFYVRRDKTYIRDISRRKLDGEVDRARCEEGLVNGALLLEDCASVVVPGMRERLLGLKQFALSLWVKRKSPQSRSDFIFDVGEWSGSSITLGYGRVSMMGPGCPCDKPMPPDSWHHVVLQFDGKKLMMYVDGQVGIDADRSDASLGRIGAFACRIGRQAKDYGAEQGRWFEGRVDELVVFNRILSEQEVKELHRMGQTGISLAGKEFVELFSK